jgi:MscS family membrane protein|tara:strand:+ start:623 stop:1798 length:1176 start_codon:yes stop_codon:yes gene_type:complete
MLQSLGEVWFLSEYWGAFIRDPIRGPSMSEAVPGDGPFSDFNLEADIMGFSAGTLTCLVIIGIMSLLIGHFFRKSVLPRILGRMFGREMKSGDMLGTRGSRAVGLAVTLVFFVEFVEILDGTVTPVWDEDIVNKALSSTVSLYILVFLFAAYGLVGSVGAILSDDEDSTASQKSLVSIGESLGRMGVFVLSAFVVAGVAGFDLNGIIAGLGITGLALALAAKDSVSNMFGALSIIIDRPFNLGDWVKVGGIEGEVVDIGMRMTVLRTGLDTIITVPNANLVNSPIENFSQRRFRRVVMPFEFEVSSESGALQSFCERMSEMLNADERTVNEQSSWVKILSMGSSSIVVQANFYTQQSSDVQRAMSEDALVEAKKLSTALGLEFHEPRLRRS